ncbi:MAG: basic amino acid/polyamine antiporter, family, partial [Gaiellaceae bacterium]|nr:basic amino acid/polyamine antiporter, family [Gaiellaceae bacterium]
YIITIAISAFFAAHYAGRFVWDGFNRSPGDILFAVICVALLALVNVRGVKDAVSVNLVLAVVDFLSQVAIVALGFFLVFSPDVLLNNLDFFGETPTLTEFLLAIPIGTVAYTGIETISNMAGEARDQDTTIPAAIKRVMIAVFAIYFPLPMIALSALPVIHGPGGYFTKLGLPPEKGGFANDPVLGLVQNLGLHGSALSFAKVYVGVLAATILFIATNAGVIGASRITYSMASYRQLPEIFRRLHPTFKTPWLSLIVFAGIISIAVLLPGQTTFLGDMYAFGAMLSFTIAHGAIVALRVKERNSEPGYRVRPNVRIRGVDWPIFAILGGLGTAAAWIVVVVQHAGPRWAGLGWLVFGLVAYIVYRRRLGIAPAETTRLPLPVGRAIALEYRNILVPIVGGPESDEAMDVACRLAAERRASIAALSVIELPLQLPADAQLDDEEERADEQLDEARAIGDSYGVEVATRLVRSRKAGRAIVDEATRRQSEIIVMGSPRGGRRAGKAIFGDTVDFVLKHAPCRVMVAASEKAA